MAEIENQKDLERWLESRPEETRAPDARLIAARAALRALPFLHWAVLEDAEERRAAILLPSLRAMAVSSQISLALEVTGIGPKEAHAIGLLAASAANSAVPFSVPSMSAAYVCHTFNEGTFGYTNTAVSLATRAAEPRAAELASYAKYSGAQYYSDASWKAVEDDATLLEQGEDQQAINHSALWPDLDDVPENWSDIWTELKDHLRATDEGWDYWIEWYEDIIRGRPRDQHLELKIIKIDYQIWRAGPKALNAEIARIVAEHNPQVSEPADETAHSPKPMGESEDPSSPVLPAQGLEETSRLSPVDYRYDATTHKMQACPHDDDAKALDSQEQFAKRDELLLVLGRGCADLSGSIRKHDVNVPPFFVDDLDSYAEECEKAENAVPGWLEFLGSALVRAQQDLDIRHGLGSYLQPRLDDIVARHRELLQIYFPGAVVRDAEREDHQLPTGTDPLAVVEEHTPNLDEAEKDRGPDELPAMDADAVRVLRAQILSVRQLTERISLSPDAELRALMERERQKVAVSFLSSLAQYYQRLAIWADQPGPKLGFRLTGVLASIAALLKSLGIV
ncbi:MAG: hypothetical protein AAF674_07840 [Pseudomonadota bacterium]